MLKLPQFSNEEAKRILGITFKVHRNVINYPFMTNISKDQRLKLENKIIDRMNTIDELKTFTPLLDLSEGERQ
jgi:hypothetical protein